MLANPLFDTQFLEQLANETCTQTHVRITALDYRQQPKESLEGLSTSGNINIDGNSATRRSCSLSLRVLPDTHFTDAYWALDNLFSLEIGVKNTINNTYADIIWFKKGVFVITNFSKVQNTTSIDISLSGQDKMCLLDGSIGGALPEQTNFGVIELEDGTEETVPLFTIIQKSLLEFGNERLDKIIINDLDYYGLEQLEYHGEQPLYLIYQPIQIGDIGAKNGVFKAVTVDGNTGVWLGTGELIKLKNIPNYYKLNALDLTLNSAATWISVSSTSSANCVVIKMDYGDTIGYRSVDLIYPGDLIENAGSSLTQVYTKIVNALNGAYEFFYDVNGNFIFQKKQNYVSEVFSPIHGEIVEPQMLTSPYSFRLADLSKVTNINYSPNIKNLKNDFVISGSRQNADSKTPIRVRYAIDTKPTHYCNYLNNTFYYTDFFTGAKPLTLLPKKCDWREIIYQMAKDYNKYNEQLDFFYRLKAQNNFVEDDGLTGYENYYAMMLGFWRELYFDGENEQELPVGYSREDYYPKGHQHAYWNKKVYTQPTQINFWIDFLDVGDGELLKLNKKRSGARLKHTASKQDTTVFTYNVPDIIFYTGAKKPILTEQSRSYSSIWIPASVEKLFVASMQQPSLIDQVNELLYTHCCCQETITLNAQPIYHLEPNTRIYIEGIGDLIVSKISYALGHNSTMSLTCTKVIDSIY